MIKKGKIVFFLAVLVCLLTACKGKNESKEVNATIPYETTEEPTTESNLLSDEDLTVFKDAKSKAAMYDYDTAINMVSKIKAADTNSEIQQFINECKESKSKLVQWSDNSQITHIFFHSLVKDSVKAFASEDGEGYNTVMTTIKEFNEIIDEMYERGFVMVSLHDIAKIVDHEDGTRGMEFQPIYLPEGKKPFVLSIDDVSYYEYMDGDGFANRLVIDENGKVVNEMDNEDGTKTRGNFDVMPLIDAFVEEHPDFSYHGSKGVIALTGYSGVLGYRTSYISYAPKEILDTKIEDLTTGRFDKQHALSLIQSSHQIDNPNIEEDRVTAAKVAQAMRDNGWEFASHSWGHMDMGTVVDTQTGNIIADRFERDATWWNVEVESVVGDTDIIIFAYGADIYTWKKYESGQQAYEYLKGKGFDYFCNVDSCFEYPNHAWVQISNDAGGTGFLRQGRRNIDGTMLFKAVLYPNEDYVNDIIDPEKVFDTTRPVPIPNVTNLPDDFDAATWELHSWVANHKK